MRFFTHTARPSYSRDEMPQAKREHGPWGEALRYWLNEKKLSQADLVKGTGIQAKTISRIVRGFHTRTRVLEDVARFLGVPLERLLVSPLRQNPTADNRQRALALFQEFLREIDGHGVDSRTLDLAQRIQQLPAELRESTVEMVVGYEKGSQYGKVSKKAHQKIAKMKA
jgi:transcriptional regulator with XRE-family HTH domain